MSVRLSIEVTDIVWDTDGEAVEGLPKDMAFEVEVDEYDPEAPAASQEVNDAATEHMSAETSWCVESFSFASIKQLESAPRP